MSVSYTAVVKNMDFQTQNITATAHDMITCMEGKTNRWHVLAEFSESQVYLRVKTTSQRRPLSPAPRLIGLNLQVLLHLTTICVKTLP